MKQDDDSQEAVQQVEPSAPVFISFNKGYYESEMHEHENIASQLQYLVNDYNALNLPALEPEDFVSLIKNPVHLIFDKMTGGEEVSIAGIKVHKHKAMDILQKPAGYEELIAKIESIKKIPLESATGRFYLSHSSALDRFELVNGIVVIKKATQQMLQRRFEKYATSDKAKKMLAFAQAIIDKANELEIRPLLKASTFRAIITGFDPERLELLVNGDEIVKYNSTEYRG